jgi:anhydro-N-acetylmuramic acid kinase
MPKLYIGLMSGTSADAVDAALVEFSDPRRMALIHAISRPLEASLQAQLLALGQDESLVAPGELGALDERVGLTFAEAAGALLKESGTDPGRVRAIGSHGQTVHHAPDAPLPFSMQIGDPNAIAERTGITTVADFRRRDMAAGGQGAPLVPAFHHALFADAEEPRCIVNIGGIANITLLPAAKGAPVTGFDTGPGNALMNAWAQIHRGEPYDRDGRWATEGRINEALLQSFLSDPFFRRPPPKSTGREYFNAGWLRRRLEEFPGQPKPADVQRTLCELTARGIALGLAEWGDGGERVLLCGGGAHNPALRGALKSILAAHAVTTTSAYGLDVDWVEACAFAWLAMRTVNGLPGNLTAVTGARGQKVLGGIYPGGAGFKLTPPGSG